MTLTEISGQFEFDWMWYIQSQGYFVRQAVPVTSDGNVEDVTDIDIWGIKFLPPMRHSIAVVDCKNKARSKPYERILWARGMASYVGADQVFVGLPKPNWKAIDFGHHGGISVIPYDVIKSHLTTLPTSQYGYGQASFGLYADFFAKRKGAIRSDKAWPASLFEARSFCRLGSSFTNLNRIVVSLHNCNALMNSTCGDEARRSLWMFTCCELITAFALNLMRTAEDSFFLSPSDRRGLLIKRLTYGDMPPEKAEEIIRLSSGLAFAYAKEALPLEHRAKLPPAPMEQASLPPPDYVNDVGWPF